MVSYSERYACKRDIDIKYVLLCSTFQERHCIECSSSQEVLDALALRAKVGWGLICPTFDPHSLAGAKVLPRDTTFSSRKCIIPCFVSSRF